MKPYTKKKFQPLAICTAAASMLLLTACGTVPKDRGLSEVSSLVTQKNDGILVAIPGTEAGQLMSDKHLLQLLEKPLTAKNAEHIGLQRNPLLKIKLADVGLAEADFAQAGRLRNPGFSYERISSKESSTTLLFDINGLLLMPLRRRLQAERLELARYKAAGDVFDHLAKTREAWTRAVADRHRVALTERAVEVAETSNTLTRQMSAIGHSSVLESAESEAFVGVSKTILSKQRMMANASHENLIRQLGLWGKYASALTLPEQLPDLPDQLREYNNIAQLAVDNRLDVQQVKFNLASMAANLRLTQQSGFLNVFEAGPVREKTEEGTQTGYEIELVLPIFDIGGIKKERAKIAMYQAQEEAKATAINAASKAREALWNYRSAWEIANHYKTRLLPIRQRISKENLLRYNGMLISVFDLLDDAHDSAAVGMAYVGALKNFWLADLQLKNVLVGAGDSPMMMSAGDASLTATGADEDH